jgi:hypothetical protein
MATPFKPSVAPYRLAEQVRERFAAEIDRVIGALGHKVRHHLDALGTNGRFATAAESRQVLDAVSAYQREHEPWITLSRERWQSAKSRARNRASAGISDIAALGLVDDEEVERKIIVSRLATAVTDAAGAEFNDLRLRVQALDRVSEWGRNEILLPETVVQILVQAWTDCGLTRSMWALVHAPAAELLRASMSQAYRQANEFLVEQGVMSEIDMKSRVRRADAPDGGSTSPNTQGVGGQNASETRRTTGTSDAPSRYPQRNPAPDIREMSRQAGAATRQGPGSPAWQEMPAGDLRAHRGLSRSAAYDTQIPTVNSTALARAAQETRMMTGVTPMARVRQRAQGVLGQLRRMISDRIGDFESTAAVAPPSPQLARALAEQVTPFATTEWVGGSGAGEAATQPLMEVRRVATQLRQRANDLKEKAEKPSEKATIEIVALMFQAILAEERIPAAIRVWFARLQIPVLRLALAEPDFFASIQHPARQLIDRMGGCVLGFDGSQGLGNRLEREIKRIVQVIEQYPETGRRVYQLVLDEFKKFLGRSLADNGAIQQAATLAQQVEQKEALSIQYTIELRRMLDPVPVADDVRQFLFRIWSEVLALSAVRYGAQQPETLRLKQAAADLLWAVSPKPDREDRRRVVQQLSGLLHSLRDGMATLAMPEEEQDGHIKLINDAVMAAFVSRDEGLPQEKLDDLARGLAGLEDVITDDAEGDLLLDPGMIEMMFGVDEAALEVIAAGGSMPSDGMVEWARSLELGAWFGLDVNGTVKQVQYAWRSARGQLHLFSAGVGKSYLVQTRRMAAYLQAGLLVPIEDEALTVRATREALAKLNSNPERLLQ